MYSVAKAKSSTVMCGKGDEKHRKAEDFMNKVLLLGRLTKDVEMRQAQNGTMVARFTIAVNRRFSKDGQADFINCVSFGKTAEFISKWFFKGSQISVVGSLQTSSREGQDGKKNFKTEVAVEEAYFAGSKSESTGKDDDMGDDVRTFNFSEQDYEDSDLPF